MPYHLLAFAPFAVLAGTAATACGVSLKIKFMSSKAKSQPPFPQAALRHSAEILYFPAAKSRLANCARASPNNKVGSCSKMPFKPP